MDTRCCSISVLMFPWLAHGHISPFLELAKKLTKRNFYVYFCSTHVILSSIREKLTEIYSPQIELVELHLPPLPELPPHYHTTKGLPPHLMHTLRMALDMAKPNFSNILKTIKPDLLIYDFMQPWAPVEASSLNIPAVQFLVMGTAMSSFLLHASMNPGVVFPFPAVHLRDLENIKLTNLLESSINDIKEIDRTAECIKRSSNIILAKTCRGIEAKYIDYLSVLTQKKIVPVGSSLVHDPVDEDDQTDITEWLDKKEKSSSVFVSFGSEYFPSKEDMEEIAHGLQLSKVNFIWVVRFPLGEKIKIEEALPEGFLEKVADRGMVVEEWAPQAKILWHSSIGGFVSHCGWSSLMEGMKCGVPIIAMPMQNDQPLNARLVEEVGVGMEVMRNKEGRLDRNEIARVITEVVVVKGREDVRTKVRELSKNMANKGEEEIDGMVEELVQLSGFGKQQCQP